MKLWKTYPSSKMSLRFFSFVFFILIVVLVNGCSQTASAGEASSVVESYFSAWDQKNYEIMYSAISDGFRSLEPTAATLGSYASYAGSQGIDQVKIVSIEEKTNDGTVSEVDYEIVFVVNSVETPYTGTFTLKYRPNDAVPGWKLIHPYGDNIDTS